jgi:hypothetical protein
MLLVRELSNKCLLFGLEVTAENPHRQFSMPSVETRYFREIRDFRENPDHKSACLDRLCKHLRMAFGLH